MGGRGGWGGWGEGCISATDEVVCAPPRNLPVRMPWLSICFIIAPESIDSSGICIYTQWRGKERSRCEQMGVLRAYERYTRVFT